MTAKRFVVVISLSTVLTVYAFFVYMAWEKETPFFLGGMTPEPNDSTFTFYIFGITIIWASKNLSHQIVAFLISLSGIILMHSLLPNGL